MQHYETDIVKYMKMEQTIKKQIKKQCMQNSIENSNRKS